MELKNPKTELKSEPIVSMRAEIAGSLVGADEGAPNGIMDGRAIGKLEG